MVNSDAYLVYWIHHRDHLDPKKEGYVGVTGRSLLIRSSQHTRSALDEGSELTVHRAIRKYMDELSIDLLYVGTFDECYEMEEQYRPEDNIGWNIRKGGDALDPATQRSFWDRPMYRENHIKRMKVLWKDPEFRKKNLPNVIKGVKVLQAKISERPWAVGRGTRTRHEVWPFAEELYQMWVDNGKCGKQKLGSLSGKNPDGLNKIVTMFKQGWVPSEDDAWREDFRFGKYVGDIEDSPVKPLSEESRLRISKSLNESGKHKKGWASTNANVEVWVAADDLHKDYLLDFAGYKKLASRAGLPPNSVKTIHKMFREGWVPLKDPRWIKWRDDQLCHKT